MVDGTEPIDPDERICRRVFEKSGYFKADRNPPLSQSAFNPTDRDTDGISVLGTVVADGSGPTLTDLVGFLNTPR